MRFPKGINSFSGYMDLAEEAATCQKAASGRALSSIWKAECVREQGDGGQSLQSNRHGLRGAGLRAEGKRTWKKSKSARETARRNVLRGWRST